MAHLVIAAGLWPLALSIWWKLALTLLLAASAVFYVRRDALLAAADSIVAVEVEADRTCGVQLKSSEWRECVLLDTSFVSPYFTILNLKRKNAWFARHVVILPDSLSKDEFRRSRVWLRWKCAKSRIKDSGVRI
jgi:toxin CptA